MQLPRNPTHTFKKNYDGSGNFTPIIEQFQNKINNHFHFLPDLKILIPAILLSFLSKKYLEEGSKGETVLTYLKLVDAISE